MHKRLTSETKTYNRKKFNMVFSVLEYWRYIEHKSLVINRTVIKQIHRFGTTEVAGNVGCNNHFARI